MKITLESRHIKEKYPNERVVCSPTVGAQICKRTYLYEKKPVEETCKREISEREDVMFGNRVRTGMYENVYMHEKNPVKEADERKISER